MQGHVLVIYGLCAQNSHNCFELQRDFGPVFPDFILLQMLVFFFLLSFFNNVTYGFVCRLYQFSSIPSFLLLPVSDTGDSERVSRQRWGPATGRAPLSLLRSLFWGSKECFGWWICHTKYTAGLAIQKVRFIIVLHHRGLQTCKWMCGLFHSGGTPWVTSKSAGLSTCLDRSQLIKT